MPYFTDPSVDPDLHPQGYSISGASPTTDSSGAATSAPGQKNPQNTTGSGFQNLDSYLQANQPQQFGQQVADKVGQDVTNAQSGIQQGTQSFENKVQSANQVPTSDQISSALSDPTSVSPSTYQTWENQSYSGPQSLSASPSDYSQYYGGVNQAQTTTQLLGTEPGRFTLLDSYFGRPGYSQGEKSLDNLLVQQGGIGNETVALQNQATQLGSQAAQGEQALSSEAATQAGNVEQGNIAARAAIGVDANGNVIRTNTAATPTTPGTQEGALGNQYDLIDQETSAANTANANQYKTLQADLASGNLTPAELSQLGIQPGTYTYGASPSQYLSAGAPLQYAQVETDAQRAQLQALSDLAGVTNTYATPAQAATPAFNFQTASFLNDQSAKQAQYEPQALNAIRQVTGFNPDLPSSQGWQSPSYWTAQAQAATNLANDRSQPNWTPNYAANWTKYANQLNNLASTLSQLQGVQLNSSGDSRISGRPGAQINYAGVQ